jgi:hypothetical protein
MMLGREIIRGKFEKPGNVYAASRQGSLTDGRYRLRRICLYTVYALHRKSAIIYQELNVMSCGGPQIMTDTPIL